MRWLTRSKREALGWIMIRAHIACVVAFGVLLLTAAVGAEAADAPTFLLRWGTFGAGPGQFGAVLGIGIDPLGQVYIADPNLNRIQVFTGDSLLLRTIGSPGAGPGQFRDVRDVAVDHSGNVYALDNLSATPALGRIQVFDVAGNFVRQWALPVSRLSHSIALSSDDSLVYATVGVFVLKYTVEGVLLAQWSYMNTTTFSNSGIAVGQSGAVYVASQLDVVIKYSPTGEVLGVIAPFGNPLGVALDGYERLYVSGGGGNLKCRMLDENGTLLAAWGAPGVANGEFTYPIDLAVAPNGDIFVVDEARPWIQKFGLGATPALRCSWGNLKARFR